MYQLGQAILHGGVVLVPQQCQEPNLFYLRKPIYSFFFLHCIMIILLLNLRSSLIGFVDRFSFPVNFFCLFYFLVFVSRFSSRFLSERSHFVHLG